MNRPEMYADVTFLLNFVMDYLILWATGRLSGVKISHKRLLAASCAGGLYAVGYLLPFLSLFYYLPAKFGFSVLLVLVGVKPASWAEFKKAFIFFYIISFTAAGATVAFSYLTETQGRGGNYLYLWLLGGVIAALLIGVFGGRYLKNHVLPGILRFNVELTFGDNHCNGAGFLDTGNSLKDPLTSKPVIVAEYGLIKNCLPPEFQRAVEFNDNEAAMLEGLMQSTWAARLRVIPFTSIGKKNGMMVGVRADQVVVTVGSQPVFHRNAVIGIYKERLSPEGTFQLLIPAEMVEG